MSKELEKIKKRRANMRRMTTQIINSVEGFINELTDDSPTKSEKIVNLKAIHEQLISKAKELKVLDKQIEDEVSEAEFENEITIAEEYQEKVIFWKCKIMHCIESNSNCNTNSCTKPIKNSETELNTSFESKVNLPKLSISKYYGDPSLWLEFWNQFQNAIDNNPSLTDIDRFSYLRQLLGGSASSAVQGFSLTNENYKTAIKLLEDRFGRRDLVVNSHMSKLLNLEPVKNISNMVALRKLYDDCEIQIRNLESLNVTSGTYGQLLCPILIKLIPDEIALDFNRIRKSKDFDVSELMEFIRSEIECRETSVLLTQNKKTKINFNAHRENNYDRKHTKPNIPTAATLFSSVNHKCIFCNNSHANTNCTEVTLDEKRNKIITQGLCLKCLKRGHRYNLCWAKIKPCDLCNSIKHCTASCGIQIKKEIKPKNETVISATSHIAPVNMPTKTVLLQTCSAIISKNKRSQIIRILMDSASQRSFLSSKVQEKMKFPIIRRERLLVYSFGSPRPVEKIYDVVGIKLTSKKDPTSSIEIEALVTFCITGVILDAPTTQVRELLQSRQLEISDVETNAPIDLLIGADYFWLVNTGEIMKLNNSMYAIHSIFGWSIQGRSEYVENSLHNCVTNFASVCTDVSSCQSDLTEQLKCFWNLESIGITDKKEQLLESDCETISQFENDLKIVNDRYETPLLWGNEKENLQSNFKIAEVRFSKLKEKLKINKWLLENYEEIINEQIETGIAEEATLSVNKTYYMPHRAVVRTDKTTSKVRVVFDASAKGKNCSSLNDCLLSGPNLNPNVLDMILKFRKHKVAFCADLEKAFLQISIRPDNRDYLRFLWFSETHDSEGLRILRMTRLPFGATCSPFILASVIKYHIRKYKEINREVYEMLNNNIYVDDLFYGANTVNEALTLSKDAISIMKDASMNLRKFKTNSTPLRSYWIENDITIEENENVENSTKMLGINWNYTNDVFKLDVSSILETLSQMKYTKRFVLQIAARIFDPVGFISPFVVRVKCLLQELWIRGIDWDEELPEDMKDAWSSWCSEITEVQTLTVSRYYFMTAERTNDINYELHVFCDANPKIYGAVAYFRYADDEAELKTSFVTSKSRVAPLKKLSLPRLELMSALIAARLANYLMKLFELPENKMYLWTDSSIVLHWLKGSALRWKPFVANRVIEIQELTNPARWKHCCGKLNPADIITKGSKLDKLKNDSKWWYGPTFLTTPKEQWPQEVSSSPKLNDEEIMKESKITVVATSTCESNPVVRESLLNLDNYSSLTRVIRITAWMIRFISNLKNKNKNKEHNLNAEEIKNAENILIKDVQIQAFSEEYEMLGIEKVVSKKSKLFELSPFIDEAGLLRIGGRLQHSELQYDEKHPILLPAKTKYTELLVRFAHERVAHFGVATTLSYLRSKFWIIRGRQFIKSILNRCMICKRYSSQPGVQVMAPLPSARTNEAPPFCICGLDFAGPLFCKGHTTKYYILLITCAVTRAIHLEIVSDLTTEIFLLAFRRFIARRGLCQVIYSDNAKTFKRADQDLKKIYHLINHPDLKEFYGSRGIQWRYIIDRGAWWGGFYERLVRSVKTSLRKTISRSSLSVTELETVLVEIEAIINSRPITFVYSDSNEAVPLTPAHFLIGRRLTSLPPTMIIDDTCASTRTLLVKKYNYRERLMTHFWNRWRKEYLLNLKSANSNLPVTKITEFKVGDVVLINDNRYPRNVWKMARIMELFTGRDGKVRSCSLKTKSGVIKRPVQLIHSLEMN